MINIYTSLIVSVITQVVTGIIDLSALFVKVPPEFSFLKQMIFLELLIQFIKGSFYVY